MAKVKFSPAARADLKEIGRYSKREFGVQVAQKYLHGFEDAFALLRTHPQAGPVREEYGIDIRCLMHRRHRILYRLEGEVVCIAAIIHHARSVNPDDLK